MIRINKNQLHKNEKMNLVFAFSWKIRSQRSLSLEHREGCSHIQFYGSLYKRVQNDIGLKGLKKKKK